MTTKTATATTISFHRVVNQIAQKFSMNSDEKKLVSDFIKPRVKGEIEVSFVESLPDGNFEHIECLRAETAITLYHSSDTTPNTFYVVVREIIKEEKEVEPCLESLSAMDRDKIMIGTIKRLKEYLSNFEIAVDDLAETKIYNFLTAQFIAGRIFVMLTQELPASEEHSKTKILVGENDLHLEYGANPVQNAFVHVLWVNVKKNPEMLRRKFLAKREDQFRRFWENKELPDALLTDVLKQIDLDKPVEISVLGFVKDWGRKRKKETGPIIFVGQIPDPYTGNFIADKPIGYVTGNRVVITSPGTPYIIVCHEFK